MIKDSNYFTVQGFMVNRLDLKGAELIIYAIIYGFSQTNDQGCTCTQKYLADFSNTSLRGVKKVIKSLVDKKLINKKSILIDGKNRNLYTISDAKHSQNTGEQSAPSESHIDQRGTECTIMGEQSAPSQVNKVHSHGGTECTRMGEQSAPNNIIYNNIYNTSSSKINKNDYEHAEPDTEKENDFQEILNTYENVIGATMNQIIAEDVEEFLQQGFNAKLITYLIKDTAKRENIRAKWKYVDKILRQLFVEKVFTLEKYLKYSENYSQSPNKSQISLEQEIEASKSTLAELQILAGAS